MKQKTSLSYGNNILVVNTKLQELRSANVSGWLIVTVVVNSNSLEFVSCAKHQWQCHLPFQYVDV